MKKLYLILSLTLILQSISYADLIVIYKTDTKEIYTVSEKDDTIVPNGYSKEILPGDFSNYELLYHPVYYKLNNKKFIVNTQKISDEEQKKQQEEAKKAKKEQDKKSAKEKLKGLGLTEDEVSSIFN